MSSSSEDKDTVFDTADPFADELQQPTPSLLRTFFKTETPLSSDTDSEQGPGDKYSPTQEDSLRESGGHDIELHLPNQRVLESVQPSQLRYPKSQYAGYESPLPVYKESTAIEDLLQELDRQRLAMPKSKRTSPSNDYEELELSNFVVYLPDNRHHPFELWSLQDLASKTAYPCFLFDGILSVGNVQRYVEGVPFDLCSIGNYGEDLHDVGDNIWIRSTLLAGSEIYYRLKSPAPEYARFYHSFMWVAGLAKHFVDYCQAAVDERKQVSVHNFRTDFSRWIQKMHGESPDFQSWYRKYESDDFRRAVAANIQFLFKESIGVDDELRAMPIWNELLERDFIPVQQPKESKTVVTPYVYDCFEHLRFGHLLKSVRPTTKAQDLRASQGKALDLPVDRAASHPAVGIPLSKASMPVKGLSDDKSVSMDDKKADFLAELKQKIKAIRVGDVLSVTKDGEGSVWKDEVSRWKAADDCWYIYVQEVHESSKGKRSFSGLWLYKSSDTCCAKMKYPFPNELFLSDNCTCSHGRIPEDEILDVVTVAWHAQPSKVQQGLFVRQVYLENEKFETLKEVHMQCEHLRRRKAPIIPKQYPIGQTVLVPPPERQPKHTLEPYEIIDYVKEGTRLMAILRQLLRRQEMPGQSARRPNELVYSSETHKVEAKNLERTCLVRFYREDEVEKKAIPAPYNRDGTGNAFYITTRLVENAGRQELKPIHEDLPQTMIQGFDPTAAPPRKPLQGLDLYCGGGNFGRGLEEGGALHNKWAVDYAKIPIHSYYANLKDPAATKLCCGSVDDQLYQALHGNPKRSDLVPMPGDVDFISAGSPCQGFSSLNVRKNNEKGLKNQSLVASVAAYVDFYRPKYGLLENVMTMAQKGLGRDEDVLSQLICAIVGMGYQLQIFVLDAWSCGSPQSRSRLFVSFAAPGCEPLEHPQLSHSHPSGIRHRGLGKLANGQSFGQRIHGPTPFEYVTSSEATKDLPDIGDGQTYQCTKHPDHVVPISISTDLRSQINAIPTWPRGSKFSTAWDEGNGVMTKEQRNLFPRLTKTGRVPQCVQKESNAWGRVHPNRLFRTIVACTYPLDSRMGTCLHWDQQRTITAMEARRAQSFPDEEVLVGNPREKWKVVGNSVSRAVSLALGLSLREAWLKNSPDDETKRVPVAKDAVLKVKPTQAKAVHRAVQSTRPQQEILGEDSDELRGEEATGRKFGESLGPLPLRSPSPSNSDTSTLVSGPITQTNTKQKSLIRQLHSTTQETKILPPVKNLKRSHSIFQETRILPSERAYKTPRLTDSASISSGSKESTPGAPSSGMNPAKGGRRSVGSLSLSQSSWSASSLSSNHERRGISNLQVPQKWTYDEARDRNLGINNEDSEGNRGKLPTTSTSSHSPYLHPRSFGALPTQGQSKAPNPTPSNRQSFTTNILSENEILIPRLLPIPKPKPLPAKKYVPVDNSIFNAYAQTSRVMRMTPDTHNSRRRRARKRL